MGVNKMVKIRIVNVYPSGGFVRLPTADGKPSTVAMEGDFFGGRGVDGSGSKYTIYWWPRDGYDPDTADESDACDWAAPAAIVVDGEKRTLVASADLVW